MHVAAIGKLGPFLSALFRRVAAAGAEGAAGGRVQGAGDITGEDDALVIPGDLGIGNGYSGHRLRV